MKKVQEYTEQLKTRESHHLTSLDQGRYVVHAVSKVSTKYGHQYKLLLQHDDFERNIVVWGNTQVSRALDNIPDKSKEILTETGSGCLMLYQHPIGTLRITGRGTNYFGGLSVYVSIEIDVPSPEHSVNDALSKAQADYNETKRKVEDAVVDNSRSIAVVPRNELLQYKDYDNLSRKPLDSLLKVEAIGWIQYYGKERLLIKIGDEFYQAGADLENKVENIVSGCYLRIQKFRVAPTTRQKYAVCDIVLENEWHKMITYNKAKMLSCPDGSLNVVDVQSVMVKGKKRKLLLSNDGTVYRLKKSKLEGTITSPGFY